MSDKEHKLLIEVAKVVIASEHHPGSVPELKAALDAVLTDKDSSYGSRSSD